MSGSCGGGGGGSGGGSGGGGSGGCGGGGGGGGGGSPCSSAAGTSALRQQRGFACVWVRGALHGLGAVGPSGAERVSSCELEMDCLAEDVLNAREVRHTPLALADLVRVRVRVGFRGPNPNPNPNPDQVRHTPLALADGEERLVQSLAQVNG